MGSIMHVGDFPNFQWLRLRTPDAGCTGSIPGQETKIPHATTKDPMCLSEDLAQQNK